MLLTTNDLYLASSGLLAVCFVPSFTLKLLIVAIVALTWVCNKRPPGVPDGPIGLPALGFLPLLGKAPHKTLNNAAQKYGQIFSIWMGERFTIVLNDYQSINKAFVENADVFSGRTEDYSEVMFASEKDLIFSDGPEWKENRKFVIANFKTEFGAGSSVLEQAILGEIHYLLIEIEKMSGKVFDPKPLLAQSISNVILAQVTGKRYGYNDEQFVNVIKCSDALVRENSSVAISAYVSWAKQVPIVKGSWNRSREANKEMDKLFFKLIEAAKQTHTTGSTDNFIHAYLTERKQRQELNDKPELFDDTMLVAVLKNLFTAGSDTLLTTLRWCLYFLTSHPDIQKKIQKEIDDVIGAHRTPSLADRPRMPYIEAVFNEVLRIVTIAPLSAPHRATEDVKIDGHFIPKNASVIPNLWAVHHDEKLFPNAKSFRPERFLDEDGNLKKCEYLIPFSVGKRACLASQMARSEGFLLLASLLQRFTFKIPENAKLSTDSHISFTIELISLPILAEKRME